MKITITKTESNPRGVAVQVLAAEGPQQPGWLLDTMWIQDDDGNVLMNWRLAGSPWAAYRPEETGPVEMDEILSGLVPLVHEVVRPVAGRIWETLPTFRAPGQEPEEAPDPTEEAE